MEEDNKKIILLNIKSIYILKQILDILDESILLNLIRYNKYHQNKLNIDINTYKEAKKIEIEIIPYYQCDKEKFINIPIKKEMFFHIYFNDNKEEIKRNYRLLSEDNIKKIKVIIDPQIVSLRNLFHRCANKKIDFIKFNNKDINDMSYMFYHCHLLEELNISKLKTNKVTKMICMFAECKLLKELDLSNFNTENVTHMSNMFLSCDSLKKLDLSSFNTNNVIKMDFMFFGCKALEELNLTNFNTNNVITMNCMFCVCSSLKELNISSGFNTSKVKDMDQILNGCNSLKNRQVIEKAIGFVKK